MVKLTERTLWLDETATISASTRSFTGPTRLLELVQHIDLVHLAYYAVMHLWFDIVGYSPLTLRAPSAVAIAAAAASLLLVVATSDVTLRSRGRTATLWAGYALIMYAAVLLNLWFIFLVIAHALTVVITIAVRRPGRGVLLAGSTIGMSAVATATVPFALAAINQKSQLSWLPPSTLENALTTFARDMSFSASLVSQNVLWTHVAAWISWVLAIGGMIWLIRRRPLGLALLLPWLLIPAIGLYTVSELASPTFLSRYLIMSVPALALLVAAALEAFASRWWSVVTAVGLVVLLAFGAYSWGQVRHGQPFGANFVVAAREIHDEQEAEPDKRAGIILGQLRRDAIQLLIDYPADLAGVEDLSGTAPPPGSFFWSPRPPLSEALGRVSSFDVVWCDGRPSGADTKLVATSLTTQGFRAIKTTRFHGGMLVRYQHER